MLLSIKLDRDQSGHISELASEVDRKKICPMDTIFTGLIPVSVRNKSNKVTNQETLICDPTKIDFGRREYRVLARGQTRPKATIVIDMNTGRFEVTVAPEERKRALSAEFEISTKTPKKATA